MIDPIGLLAFDFQYAIGSQSQRRCNVSYGNR